MTATVEETTKDTETTGGRIARVIGPVVDIEFPVDSMPDMYNLLETELTIADETRTLSLEVAQHIGDGMVRAISLQPTRRPGPGRPGVRHRRPDHRPGRDATLGHVFNTLASASTSRRARRSTSRSGGASTARRRRSTSSSPRRRCSRPASRSSTC